jgi:hypothetical protein
MDAWLLAIVEHQVKVNQSPHRDCYLSHIAGLIVFSLLSTDGDGKWPGFAIHVICLILLGYSVFSLW